jgi:hypothetical protein
MTYIARCAELRDRQAAVHIWASRDTLLGTTKEVLEVVCKASRRLGAAARWLGLWCHPVGRILTRSGWC